MEAYEPGREPSADSDCIGLGLPAPTAVTLITMAYQLPHLWHSVTAFELAEGN